MARSVRAARRKRQSRSQSWSARTVGPAAHNLTLSRARARSIASWFAQHGLKIGIAFEGFGESALLVKNADEVDEPKNRRVDYILAIQEPVVKTTSFHPAWKRIQ